PTTAVIYTLSLHDALPIYNYKETEVSSPPTIEVDRNFNPFREHKSVGKQTTAFKSQTLNNWDSLYVGLESKENDVKHDFSEVHLDRKSTRLNSSHVKSSYA